MKEFMMAPESKQITAEDLKTALDMGGRAEVTVRSKKTGAHLYLLLACKKRKPEGQKGYLSRATKAGRVGLGDADIIVATDPDLEWPEGKIGAYGKKSDRFYAENGADAARVWAADHVIAWALGAFPMLGAQADVFLASKCAMCGHRLEDPVSVARGIGPECFGAVTGSKKAKHAAPVATVPEQGSLLAQVQILEGAAV